MKRIFTEYFHSLDLELGAPSPERFDAFWRILCATLKFELQQRGLWSGPPRYLGVAEEDENWTPLALEELAVDCYTFMLDRLRGLKQQLKVKPNIEGLVRLNIRHFLYERQKRHDPLGFRIFEVLREAVRLAIQQGDLSVLEGEATIGNSTLLVWTTNTEGEHDLRLDSAIESWRGVWIRDLVSARGKRKQAAISELARRLKNLSEVGAESLRFKELSDVFKSKVRGEWQALWMQQHGEIGLEEKDGAEATLVPIVAPESLFEHQESFEQLTACVSVALGRLDGDAKTQEYLTTLWGYLRTRAPDPNLDSLPSRRKASEQLGIPRDRLPGLYATLGQLVRACQQALSGKGQIESRDSP